MNLKPLGFVVVTAVSLIACSGDNGQTFTDAEPAGDSAGNSAGNSAGEAPAPIETPTQTQTPPGATGDDSGQFISTNEPVDISDPILPGVLPSPGGLPFEPVPPPPPGLPPGERPPVFEDPFLLAVPFAAAGTLNVDTALDPAQSYRSIVSLRSLAVFGPNGESIREFDDVQSDTHPSPFAAIDDPLAWSIFYATEPGIPRDTELVVATLFAAIYASDNSSMSEEVAYFTAEPMTLEFDNDDIENAINSFMPVSGDLQLTSSAIPISSGNLRFSSDLDDLAEALTYTSYQSSASGNTLYLMAAILDACEGDEYTLYLDDNFDDAFSISVPAKLLRDDRVDGPCVATEFTALKFDLLALLFEYERRHRRMFINVTVAGIGEFRGGAIPLPERRRYVNEPGCTSSNSCTTNVVFELDGILNINDLQVFPFTGPAGPYAVSADGRRVYANILGLDVTGEFSADGQYLDASMVGRLYLEPESESE